MSFTYDANGNTLSKMSNGQMTNYQWDYEDKLTRIDSPNGSSHVFTTNADGQRMTASDAGGNRRFIYDGTNLIAEQDVASGNLIAAYDHGVGGISATGARDGGELLPVRRVGQHAATDQREPDGDGRGEL